MSIYVAARDLAGLVPIGTHQFIVIDNLSTPYKNATLSGKTIKPQDLGNGKLGYVIGAHNRGNLEVIYFEKNDYIATQEYFDKKRVHFFKSDFDTELIKVKYANLNENLAAIRIFRLVEAYSTNQTMDKIGYPAAGLGFNSNSWVQTIIQLSGGAVSEDLKGLDISNEKRIPKTYFMPVCPINPRPTLN